MILRTFVVILAAFVFLTHAFAAGGGAGGSGGGGGSRPANRPVPNRNNPDTKPVPPAHEPETPSKPADSKPADSKPADSEPAGAKPVTPPKVQSNPQKPIPRLPIRKEEKDDDASSIFSLGEYKEDEPRLFHKFGEQNKPFFSVMYNFFEAKGTYLPMNDAYIDATGSQNPWNGPKPTGQPLRVTPSAKSPNQSPKSVTFDPKKAEDTCRILTALAGYCGEDGGEACACYSATYYVPDQWNSLAAGCAVATSKCPKQSTASEDSWCEIARTAAKNTDYCTRSFASSDGPEVVKFAATTVKADTPSSQTDVTTTSSSRSSGSASATTTGSDTDRMAPTSRIVIISTPTTDGFPNFPSQTSLGSSGASALYGSKSAGSLSWVLFSICTLFYI